MIDSISKQTFCYPSDALPGRWQNVRKRAQHTFRRHRNQRPAALQFFVIGGVLVFFCEKLNHLCSPTAQSPFFQNFLGKDRFLGIPTVALTERRESWSTHTYANLCDGFCLPDSATRAHSFPFDRAVGCLFETFFTGFVFPLASLIDGLIDNGGLSDAVSEPINSSSNNAVLLCGYIKPTIEHPAVR